MARKDETNGLELSAEASEALQRDLVEPGADTPERRAMYKKMDAVEVRLKKDGYLFDDEQLPTSTKTRP